MTTPDPLRPRITDQDPTPAEEVAALSPGDRAIRVGHLMALAFEIVDTALEKHLDEHRLVGKVVLFSGGNDSTTLAHLFRNDATHAAMANTGIGIEQTRQYVRDTCASWGLPLIEKHPPDSYRDMVLGRVYAKTGPNKGAQVYPGGFPGPSAHAFYFQRLKERCFEQVRRDLVQKPRQERVLYIAGRRRQESDRRKDVPLFERRGSTIWASPLAFWTKPDMVTYRLLNKGTVPRNLASDLIHMSGECLCGAFAHKGELDEIAEWFPDTAAEIRALEAEVREAGFPEPYCTWGHGRGGKPKSNKLCGNCVARFVPPAEPAEPDDEAA